MILLYMFTSHSMPDAQASVRHSIVTGNEIAGCIYTARSHDI